HTSCFAASYSTTPQLLPLSPAISRPSRPSRPLQKVHDMNIATEPKLSGKPIDEKGRKRPVRMVRWFIIVGLILGVVVGGIVYFQFWKDAFLKNMFATMKPPPATVSVVEVKSEVVPNLLTAVGGLAAVHQVNVTTDVAGRITDIQFKPG